MGIIFLVSVGIALFGLYCLVITVIDFFSERKKRKKQRDS